MNNNNERQNFISHRTAPKENRKLIMSILGLVLLILIVVKLRNYQDELDKKSKDIKRKDKKGITQVVSKEFIYKPEYGNYLDIVDELNPDKNYKM